MECPHKIPPLGTHQHNITRCTETATPGQALDTVKKIKKGEKGPDYSLGIADIAAPIIMICTEATPDCNKGTGTTPIEATQETPFSTLRPQPQNLPWHASPATL